MFNAQLTILTQQPLLLPFVDRDMRVSHVTLNTWQATCICPKAACLGVQLNRVQNVNLEEQHLRGTYSHNKYLFTF